MAGSHVGALDSTVVVSPERRARKDLAAVEYHERELRAAEEAVRRLQGKAGKLREHAEQADRDLQAAIAEVEAAAARLAEARDRVEGSA